MGVKKRQVKGGKLTYWMESSGAYWHKKMSGSAMADVGQRRVWRKSVVIADNALGEG